MLAILLVAGGLMLLSVLFATDARERAAAESERRVHAVLCSGRDCDIAPSVE